jgi:elongation factor G
MDRPGASFEKTLDAMRKKLEARPIPITIPVGTEGNLRGVIHLVKMKYLTFEGDRGKDVVEAEIPADMVEEVHVWRDTLVEAASEFSDDVLAAALEWKPVTPAQLNAAIRKGTHRGHDPADVRRDRRSTTRASSRSSTPSSTFLPSPLDVPVVSGVDPETDKPLTRDLRKDKTLDGLRVQDRLRQARRHHVRAASTRASCTPTRRSTTRGSGGWSGRSRCSGCSPTSASRSPRRDRAKSSPSWA